MNKQWRLEKKKAQYEKRIRALEARVIQCQELIEQQHAMILAQDQDIASYRMQLIERRHPPVTALATTRSPYQSPDSQMPSQLQSSETIENSPESPPVLETPLAHTEPA